MTERKRLGVYGGTFSPPHLGHIRAAERFIEELSLDELIIIPAFLPPHKEIDGEATAEERIEMCSLAFSHIEKARISDMEIKRGGRSYTYLTLEELTEENTDLFLLVGTDMILTFHTWKNPERIFDLATICFVRRENDEALDLEIKKKCEEYKDKFGAKIVEIPLSPLEVSSTELRLSFKGDFCESNLLSAPVFDYIKRKGLYSGE